MSAVAGGVDSSGNSITWLAFRNTTVAGNGVTGLWNLLPFYSKDGSRAGTNNPDITGGYTVELDTFWVASLGSIIIHQKGISANVCWNISEVGMESQVTCP